MKKWALLLAFLAAGLAGCSRGPKIALDPESEAFYETARLIMTDEEGDVFRHLPDAASRKEFIQDFWLKRDPDPETEENEFKKEFFARIEYANKRFREGVPGWKTDRGRIYIYMGPPDKFEEFFNHDDPDIRGPILFWIYYNYELGIEFVDERNDGRYRIRQYDGNFFEALDNIKLGQAPPQKGEKRKFANFKLKYNQETKEIEVSLPAEAFNFKDEGGQLRADLEFHVYVYGKNQAKLEEFKEIKSISEPEARFLEMKNVVISLSHEFSPGEYYLDVIITGKEATLGKTRKIFSIRVL